MKPPVIHYESSLPKPAPRLQRVIAGFFGCLALYLAVGGLAGFGYGFGHGPVCIPVHGSVLDYLSCSNRLNSVWWNIFIGWPRVIVVPLTIVGALLRGALHQRSMAGAPIYWDELGFWALSCVPFVGLMAFGWQYWYRRSKAITKVIAPVLLVLWLLGLLLK